MITDELFRPLQAPDTGAEDLAAAWRGASDDARRAYENWRDAAPDGRSEAYCVYLAAADREGAAAELLRISSAGVDAQPALAAAA